MPSSQGTFPQKNHSIIMSEVQAREKRDGVEQIHNRHDDYNCHNVPYMHSSLQYL